MPDPIKNKASIVASLDDRHYVLFGKMVAGWAKMETQLAFTVASFSRAKLRSVMFLFENMTTRAKLSAAEAVMTDETTEGFDDYRPLMMLVIADCRSLAGYRHAAAHGTWLGLTSRGRMVCIDVGAKEGSYVGRLAYGVGEFETAIRRLDELSTRMKELSTTYGRFYIGNAFDFTIDGGSAEIFDTDSDVDFS